MAVQVPPALDRADYPVSLSMGEDAVHMWICEALHHELERFLAARGDHVFVGSDQFIYWAQGVPKKCVSPDVYVLPGVDQKTPIEVWKTWETGIVPSFALEITSRTWRKDYGDGPRRYDELGVPELIVFDRKYAAHPDGTLWRIHRRDRKGVLRLVEQTNRDRVRSRALGVYLRATGEGSDLRIRIATGTRGQHIVPNEAEELIALRAEVERLRRR